MLSHGYVIQARWDYVTEEQKSFIQNMYFDVGESMSEQTMADLVDYGIIDLYKNSGKEKVLSRTRSKN